MRRAVFAELLLSLVMPRERAAAAVGDLIEGRRFGLSLLSAFVRATLGQMSAGLIAQAVSLALVLTAIFRGMFVLALDWGGHTFPQFVWMGPFLGVTFLMLAPLVVGWLMARWLCGRELSAWFAVVLFVAIAAMLMRNTPFREHVLAGVTPAGVLPMLVGVLMARRRWLPGSPA